MISVLVSAGDCVVDVLRYICCDRIPIPCVQLWMVWDCQVLVGAVAGIPFLDVHIHYCPPHRTPHSLQGGQGVERC
jgi:hypothetical protein